MAKRKRPGKASEGSGKGDRRSSTKRQPLPLPDVIVPERGDDSSDFGMAEFKGVTMNPAYTRIGHYPRMVNDDRWIEAARRVFDNDGPDQFFVNLLYILRRTFGCIEWGGDWPPDEV